ncbi:MAG: hypothetical protein RIQ72_350 [Candidatus Parcubacteria bacterium]|jgi:hypothetical protein
MNLFSKLASLTIAFALIFGASLGVNAKTASAVVIIAENTAEMCTDGIDNDGDFVTDLSDTDCVSFAPAPVMGELGVENTLALCTDGIDNDFDFVTDLSDTNCAAFAPAPVLPAENTAEKCTDGIDNDGDFVTDLSDTDCAAFAPAPVVPTTPTTPSTPAITPGSQTGVSGTTGGGFSGSTGLPTGQSVLGATTGPATGASCKTVITKYMKLGDRNTEVSKLQVALNSLMGKKLAITGVYDQATFNAVVEFQKAHSKLVLKPWVDAGLMNTEIATGYAYITTIHTINSMLCGGNYGPLPALK